MSVPPRQRTPRLLLAATVLALSAAQTPGAEGQPRSEIGFLVGGGLCDGDIQGGPDGLGSVGPAYGVRAGHLFGSRLLWFGDMTVALFPTDRTPGDAERFAVRTGLDVLLGKPSRRSWFVSAAGGWGQFDFEDESLDFDRSLGSLGVGQRIALRNGALFRWELRGEALLGSEGFRGKEIQNAELLVGWAIPLGGAASRDADRDGVPDKRDRCAFTPGGARVDERGCAVDSDGDGVPDGSDVCPDTPPGARVTARGCPSDFDGDGVPDGLDRCADTAEGASVDAKGCARDSDGDGIPDGLDACEATLPGTAVGPSGCPIDSDGDGVSDDADDCPDTRRGIAVDRSGCPPLTGEEAALAEGSAPLILGGARFATGRADLDGEARATLARVASALLRRPEVRLEIGGHTDSTGTEESNLDLSRRRAEAVRDLLVSQGVDPARLVTEGYGASRPVADDATEEGRAKNRRVELKPIR